MEFKAFNKIEQIGKLHMAITQKIHGTNAQIVIIPADFHNHFAWGSCVHVDEVVELDGKRYAIRAGSRTKFITPEDDNFGFARYVRDNAQELVEKLGPGTHFGEWAGPGINSGEGLTDKTFILFDYWKFPPARSLPPRTMVVPVLYQGKMDMNKIDEVMADLKANGSKLVPGFMRPEGIVVTAFGNRFKKVFDAEETAWTKSPKTLNPQPKGPAIDVSHLLQPIRLEKLLSRDEKYLRNYPASLKDICKDYTADLAAETQIIGDEDTVKATEKALGKQLFAFVRAIVDPIKGQELNQVG